MKLLTSFVIVALAAVVASTPTEHEARTNQQYKQDLFRDKRSEYGIQYVSPCAAAAAAASLPPFGPPYHHDVPIHGGYVVPHYGYGGPHYRSVEPLEEQELHGFSDVDHITQDHMPMARYGAYGTAPAHIGPMPIPAPGPAAYGVFPNANSGGCNVPLLFSCSPSIVQGRIVQAQPHQHVSSPFDASANLYRVVMDPHMGAHENGQEEAAHDHTGATHEPSHISLHKY
ncbi:hypothetical protein O3G_MSEX007749 [Manduca sexta]|uniref:Cuticle protein n=1 Tax=Manduca sexta TaxID=7130 RepID=A0A922CNS7_MANSE|nr:hypothetical protein O3G_MSEX007749 [Manduca sexta]